jgi:hypothetical protein
MNLHLKINGKEIDLRQTPTHITYMCTMTDSGSPAFRLTGKKAHRAMFCYIEFVKSSLSGVFTDKEELDNMREYVSDHVAEILAMMETAKKIEVYVM